MFFRLCSRAPLTVMNPCGAPARRPAPRSARCRPGTCPVSDAGFALQRLGRALRRRRARPGGPRRARSRPRGRPPRSSRRRARPRSRCCRGRAAAAASLISRRLSRWCRPIDGSSSTYITPDSSEPSCDASRMRCASPPDSVAAARSSVRYSSPTSSRKPSRALTSFRISVAICARAPFSPSVDEVLDAPGDGHRRDLDQALARQQRPRATRAAGAGPCRRGRAARGSTCRTTAASPRTWSPAGAS